MFLKIVPLLFRRQLQQLPIIVSIKLQYTVTSYFFFFLVVFSTNFTLI